MSESQDNVTPIKPARARRALAKEPVRELRAKPPAPKAPAKPQRPRRDSALDSLEPLAIQVLEAQLTSDDERIAQQAAKLLLEHKWGKPTQRQEVQTEVTQIEYVTTAAAPWRKPQAAPRK